MTNDAEAQEIQGTVVSSGRFPEPAGQAEVSTPEGQEKDNEDEERPDSSDLGHDRTAADRGDDDEVVDRDAVIIDRAGEDDDEAPTDETPDEDEDDDEAPTDETRAYAETDVARADETPDEDEAPATVAGFARTPVASPASAAADETESGADAVPEADVIAEATRPGVPREAGMPAMSDLAGDPAQLHEQWSAIQSSFVDDPRASVAAAADLVSEAIEALVASIQEREHGLRSEWERDGTDTEDLRNTLRGYRGLLDQLAGL